MRWQACTLLCRPGGASPLPEPWLPPPPPPPLRRLRNTLRHLQQAKRPVRIGVVGGSITYQEADQLHRVNWFHTLVKYIKAAFPNAEVLGKNGAVPGTPSAYALMCLEMMVDHGVDLVFVGGCCRAARRCPGQCSDGSAQ